MTTHPTIPIVIDTREQVPLDFSGLDCTVEVGTCKVFDYRLRDDDGWAIERKGLGDLVNSITTTGGQRLEQAKIRRARETFDAATPIVYVVEASITGLLPARSCVCISKRASSRCRLCHGLMTERCECIKERPKLKCEFCNGTGILGYEYSRRQIGAPFAYHQLSVMLYQWGVSVLFADTRLVAACMVEAMLRRRYEWLGLIGRISGNTNERT